MIEKWPISGILPTEYKVLVKPDKLEEKTKAGIYLPDTHIEKQDASATTGKIVAVSPLAFKYDDWPEGSAIPKQGDRVAFARFAGVSIKGTDDEDYRIVNDKDIIAILKEK